MEQLEFNFEVIKAYVFDKDAWIEFCRLRAISPDLNSEELLESGTFITLVKGWTLVDVYVLGSPTRTIVRLFYEETKR